MRIVAIINQKGGCGKTTTAVNLAGVLASHGHRTLLVDLDPQSHCAAGLAIPEAEIDLQIGDALVAEDPGRIDESRLLWPVRHNLTLAPASVKLAGLEASRGGLAAMEDRDVRLARVLDRWRNGFDWVLIDCPPSIGLLTYNALRAATEVLIPVETAFLAMHGADRQVAAIRALGRRMGGQTPFHILPTMHDPTSRLSAEVLAELRKRFPEHVVPRVVRLDPRIREATSYGQPVIEYDRASNGARDYVMLAEWLVALPGEEFQGFGDSSDAADESGAQPPEVAEPVIVTRSRAEDLAERARRLLARNSEGPGVRPGLHLVEPRSQHLAGPTNVRRTLERLYGVRMTSRGVLFVHPGSPHSTIAVAGEFNGWSADATPMRFNSEVGVHEVCISLPPGRHAYRLVVDGRWIADPYNESRITDPDGRPASAVEVAAEPANALACEGAD